MCAPLPCKLHEVRDDQRARRRAREEPKASALGSDRRIKAKSDYLGVELSCRALCKNGPSAAVRLKARRYLSDDRLVEHVEEITRDEFAHPLAFLLKRDRVLGVVVPPRQRFKLHRCKGLNFKEKLRGELFAMVIADGFDKRFLATPRNRLVDSVIVGLL